MGANFTPAYLPYTPPAPFRFWCQTALPTVYDDSLSYYELLNKVVEYLNDMSTGLGNLETNVSNLYTAFNQLQTYVNTYFDSLDVQQEINNKLDAMALDGSLSALISPFVPAAVTAWLNEHLDPSTAPPVDDSLSIAGAAADAKATGDQITITRNSLKNSININEFIPKTIGTSGQPETGTTIRDVNFIWTDNSTCEVKGTATGGDAVLNIFNSSNSFPAWLNQKTGDPLYLVYSGSQTVRVNIAFYINGVIDTATNAIWANGNAATTIPANATGIRIRFYIVNGVTVGTENEPEVLKVQIFNDLSPRSIQAYIENSCLRNLGAFVGTEENNYNLNNMPAQSCGIVTSTYSEYVLNKPFSLATVYNFQYSNTLSVQIAFDFSTGQMAYRRKSTSWGDWIFSPSPSTYNSAVFNNGILAASDLNDLAGSVWVLLTSTNVYENAPFTIGSICSLEFSVNLAIQFGFQFTTGEMWYRRRTIVTDPETHEQSIIWGAWRNLTNPDSVYSSGQKYVAFGDSLCYGAVWSPTENGTLHRVKEEWRIPTRIALAIGSIKNFENEAIGGIGYLHEQGGINLIDQINSYTFTNVDLVTIMAGANDKYAETLGTYEDTSSDNTICGAILNIINIIKLKNPKTQIVIIQPTPSAVDGSQSGADVWNDIPTGFNWSMNEFDTQVSRLCHDHHVAYVNWWESSMCDHWAYVGYNGSTVKNFTHPTADIDYCLLGDFIAGKVSAFFHTVT